MIRPRTLDALLQRIAFRELRLHDIEKKFTQAQLKSGYLFLDLERELVRDLKTQYWNRTKFLSKCIGVL